MPPKGSGARGRPAAGASKSSAPAKRSAPAKKPATAAREVAMIPADSDDDDRQPQARSNNNRMDLDDDEGGQEEEVEDDEEEEDDREKVPPELITRILHEHFTQEGTRITKDANNAVAVYVDIFVREAIARAANEKREAFLEVDDLEKIAPQLLMDL
ncbi:CENP-S associating centromere protein X-domain-containing protein [Podospora australis]|uniref:CENP-S associating centromere protein X-domain-containing protein n=1 Tax=Podospora australis TaxID=1536484 RepID=A0AAN7AGD5_9PEZI|nr:CENP-S associating centromere protein X-domain-containing protein [Podospora australis]